MEDKRKFFRFKLLLKGEIELEGKVNLSANMHMADFSRYGLRILIPKKDFLNPNIIKLAVYMPQRNIPIPIIGKVKWVRPKEGGLEIGTQIQQIDAADKSEILDYAYKIWKEKEKKIRQV